MKKWLSLAFLLCVVTTLAFADSGADWQQLCVVQDARLSELSGLSESIRYPGYFWANNDSGDSLRAFLIAPSGETVAVINLQDGINTDTESLRVAGTTRKSWVYLGDTGDNLSRRQQIEIDRFEEPNIDIHQRNQEISLPFEQMILHYGDGNSTDAETLLVDAEGHVGIVTKSFLGSNLWITPQPFSTHSQVLDLAANVPVRKWRKGQKDYSLLFTDGALSGDGKYLTLMTYSHCFIWKIDDADMMNWGKVLSEAPAWQERLPQLQQPESITFTKNNTQIAVSSEGKNPPIMALKNPFLN